jgi:hypothetical protein
MEIRKEKTQVRIKCYLKREIINKKRQIADLCKEEINILAKIKTIMNQVNQDCR